MFQPRLTIPLFPVLEPAVQQPLNLVGFTCILQAMINKFKKIWNTNRSSRKEGAVSYDRKVLEQKVEKGTERAVKEYRRAFERLAEYDRT